MKVRKDLKRNEPNIQAYLKLSWWSKEKRADSSAYMMNISFLYILKPKAVYMVFFRSDHRAPHSQISPTLGLFYICCSMESWFITINFIEQQLPSKIKYYCARTKLEHVSLMLPFFLLFYAKKEFIITFSTNIAD